MTLRGLTTREILLAVGVVAVFAAIMIPVSRIVLGGSDEKEDMKRMRLVYVALSLYETSNDDLPAPDLVRVRRELGDDSLLLATNDPFANPGPAPGSFPLDPGIPQTLGSP